MSDNDTQPLTEQAPEEGANPVWTEPQNSQAAAWRAYQKAKEAWEESLRKRTEEDAKLLATEQELTTEQSRDDWWEKEKARSLAAAKWDESFGSNYPDEKQAYLKKWGPIAEEKYYETWSQHLATEAKRLEEEAKRQEPLVPEQASKDALEMMQEAYERIHIHGPFTWTMNQNHNALRGCVTCGQTWVGVMAGAENSLRWHEVEEPPEEEE